MNDTPRTNALYNGYYGVFKSRACDRIVEFARQLERELAKVTEQRDAAMGRIKCLESDLKEERRYKIEAWEQRDTLADALHKIRARVTGESSPNWENTPMTFASRDYIADVCETALATLKEEKP